jgi:hypothetical protein
MQTRLAATRQKLEKMRETAPVALFTDGTSQRSSSSVNMMALLGDVFNQERMMNSGNIGDILKYQEGLMRIQRDYMRWVSENEKLFAKADLTRIKSPAPVNGDTFVHSSCVSLFTKKDMTDLLLRLDATPQNELEQVLDGYDKFFETNNVYIEKVALDLAKAISNCASTAIEGQFEIIMMCSEHVAIAGAVERLRQQQRAAQDEMKQPEVEQVRRMGMR